MLRRLYNSLLRPRYIALYLKDKVWISLLYAFIAAIIMISPTVVSYCFHTDYIQLSTLNEAVLMIPTEYNTKVENYTFTTDKEFQIVVDTVTYNFGKGENLVSSKGVTFVFSEDKILIYQNQQFVGTDSFKTLGVEDLNFSSLSTNSQEYAKYYSMMNNIYNTYFRYSNLQYSVSVLIRGILELLIVVAILVLFTSVMAPFLKRTHKINLSIYSLTWYYVLTFIGNVFSLPYIYLLGFLIAIFFLRKALSSIKIISIPKGHK